MSTYDERLRSALLEQHRRWFDYQSGGIRGEVAEAIDCPVCGSRNRSLYFVKDMFRFERCGDCSMVFLNPRLNVRATYAFYNSEWTAIYNESKFEGTSSSRAEDDRINAANLELISRYRHGGAPRTLLEIGFGGGYFLQAARDRGYDVYGIDVDASNHARAAPAFGDHVKNCDLFDAGFAEGQFDVVYMRDVFEHVPNPRSLLAEVNRVSRKDAVLFIEVPNIDGLIYKIVGKRHVCVFGFAHLNYWSPASIETVLRLSGYETVVVVHESADFTLAEIVRYFLEPAFTTVDAAQPNVLVKFPLKMARRVLSIGWIRDLDRRFTPRIADALRRGSVIRVIARKARPPAG